MQTLIAWSEECECSPQGGAILLWEFLPPSQSRRLLGGHCFRHCRRSGTPARLSRLCSLVLCPPLALLSCACLCCSCSLRDPCTLFDGCLRLLLLAACWSVQSVRGVPLLFDSPSAMTRTVFQSIMAPFVRLYVANVTKNLRKVGQCPVRPAVFCNRSPRRSNQARCTRCRGVCGTLTIIVPCVCSPLFCRRSLLPASAAVAAPPRRCFFPSPSTPRLPSLRRVCRSALRGPRAHQRDGLRRQAGRRADARTCAAGTPPTTLRPWTPRHTQRVRNAPDAMQGAPVLPFFLVRRRIS
jgi:hypothetical protein